MSTKATKKEQKKYKREKQTLDFNRIKKETNREKEKEKNRNRL